MSKNEERQLSAIILAAGKGTRMSSPLPKVLHPVSGIPMVLYPIRAARGAGAKTIRVVAGYGLNLVKNVLESAAVEVFPQANPQGTADAVKSAQVDTLQGDVVILNGDHPLVSSEDLKKLWVEFKNQKLDLALVSCVLKDPKSFGRIVRNHGELYTVVEAADASASVLEIKEVNTGIYFVSAEVLQEAIPRIRNNNSKSEYYLTDIIMIAKELGYKVDALKTNARAAWGVNTQIELAQANKYFFKRNVKRLLEAGAVVLDPDHTYVDADVKVGPGTVIYPGCFIKGRTEIGPYCVIEPNVYINTCQIGASTQIKAGSYFENSIVGEKCILGPYARLRPDSELKEGVHLGNFVELKKTSMGKGSKAGHLSYLGDAIIGDDVNIGCGTITCNYAVDKRKYTTIIGDRVFVGSDTQFVAPVKVESDSVIASGSTIVEDVPANALAIARGRQVNKLNYNKKDSE